MPMSRVPYSSALNSHYCCTWDPTTTVILSPTSLKSMHPEPKVRQKSVMTVSPSRMSRLHVPFRTQLPFLREALTVRPCTWNIFSGLLCTYFCSALKSPKVINVLLVSTIIRIQHGVAACLLVDSGILGRAEVLSGLRNGSLFLAFAAGVATSNDLTDGSDHVRCTGHKCVDLRFPRHAGGLEGLDI